MSIGHERHANLIRLSTEVGTNPINSDESRAGAQIQDPERLRVHTRLVIGGRDLETRAMSVRRHHGDQQGARPKAEVIAGRLMSIKEREARTPVG